MVGLVYILYVLLDKELESLGRYGWSSGSNFFFYSTVREITSWCDMCPVAWTGFVGSIVGTGGFVIVRVGVRER